MPDQTNRIHNGVLGETKPCQFIFNEQRFTGQTGDTLASALLANGQQLVARSFKYHRPRGIFSAGVEEPNALVTLRTGALTEPNTRATVVEMFDGLEAKSQNHIGPLSFDVMAINDYLSPFLSAGFYYKTFMWPKSFWEKLYEPAIRRAAGLGSLSMQEDPDTYDKGFLHADLLIIGTGPAGIAAALTAGRAGMRVIIADEDFLSGGRLNHEQLHIDDQPASEWAKTSMQELASMSNVRIMTRTTVYGSFDHGIFGALERATEHKLNSAGKPRQILWRIYAKRSLLCAGATERSIAFGNNDRPGIMLAGAVRTYLNRFGVSAGKQVALFTNNDNGWQTAIDLQKAGVEVSAIVDSRDIKPPFTLSDVPVYMNNQVVDTSGRLGLQSIKLASGETIQCDVLGVSGGWNPNVHLTCHQRGRPVWNNELSAFVPDDTMPASMLVAGAANGQLSLSEALLGGHEKALAVMDTLGVKHSSAPPAKSTTEESVTISAFWQVSGSSARSWIDLQNDVTTKDIAQAKKEGFQAVEHAKRYTTLGMATDQGKTSNVLGLAIMAELANQSIPQTGTTIFRPPYTPISIGAMAGRSRGKHFRPTRLTPTHDWATKHNASFVESGMWMRAEWFVQDGESGWRDSVDREVRQTRESVGICDVTTLGKIDIQGRDAATFLDKVYANTFATLKPGKVRYGLMLREDGFVMDDGTTARLSDTHFLMTTTTANAVNVFRHLEFCRQCLWPELDVHCGSVTEQWAQVAIAGPNSRGLLESIVDKPFDISNESFPFMACAELTICDGTPARLFRISFSGELAYELAVPSRYGSSLMDKLMAAGKPFNVAPYGLEALGVMRIEKGHAAGNELNGQTTAGNIGLGRMVSQKKDCIGNVLSKRPGMNPDDSIALVGFMPVNPTDTFSAGAHFIAKQAEPTLANDEGWMSSVAFSPSLGCTIGLGFIKRGTERFGETVIAHSPLLKKDVEVNIVSPHFVDPEGERLRG